MKIVWKASQAKTTMDALQARSQTPAPSAQGRIGGEVQGGDQIDVARRVRRDDGRATIASSAAASARPPVARRPAPRIGDRIAAISLEGGGADDARQQRPARRRSRRRSSSMRTRPRRPTR